MRDNAQLTAAGAGTDNNGAVLVPPRRWLLDIAVVGSLNEYHRRSIGGELQPLPRPTRQGQFRPARTIHGAIGRVFLVGMHPPCRDESRGIGHSYIKPLRSVSSDVRMRSTCCAVNMNMPASSV